MACTEHIISLAQIAKLIEDNGGKIVSLDDEKLTHVVLDKRDDSRRRELTKRTSKYVRCALLFSGSTQTDI
jgi:DNA ligase-4